MNPENEDVFGEFNRYSPPVSRVSPVHTTRKGPKKSVSLSGVANLAEFEYGNASNKFTSRGVAPVALINGNTRGKPNTYRIPANNRRRQLANNTTRNNRGNNRGNNGRNNRGNNSGNRNTGTAKRNRENIPTPRARSSTPLRGRSIPTTPARSATPRAPARSAAPPPKWR